jgi:hypothetical protein
VRRPGAGQGSHGIASTFGSLRGMSRIEADVFLRSLGAEVRTTAGGYTRIHSRIVPKCGCVLMAR